MRCTERVIFTLGPLGEARQTSALAQRANAVAAPGQDLVRVTLVTDIPDQLVIGRVEHRMQGDGQFDHTEPGAKGNSTGNVLKPATLQNGAEINVPTFINVGDKVRVDTRTGDYIERVTKS